MSIKKITFLTFLTLLIWNIFTPGFEGTGEVEHVKVVNFMSQTGTLADIRIYPQAIHPIPLILYVPLFTVLGRQNLSGYFNLSNLNVSWTKHGFAGNVWKHSIDELHLYWTKDIWAIHILRLVSVVLGTAYVILLYHLANDYFKDTIKSLIAVAMTVLNPTFAHMFSIITNDAFSTLVALVGFLYLFQLLRKPTITRAALSGLIIGLAVSAKLTSLFFLVPAMVTFVLTPGSRRQRVKLGFIFLLTLSLTVLPYLSVNYFRYGDPLAFKAFQGNNQGFRGTFQKLGAINFLLTFLEIPMVSYWGYFGYQFVSYPGSYIYFLYLLTITAIIGGGLAFLRFVRKKQKSLSIFQKQTLILAISVATFMVKLFILTLDYSSFAGRFLFAIHPALALLTIYGLISLRSYVGKLLRIQEKIFLIGIFLLHGVVTFLAVNRQAVVTFSKSTNSITLLPLILSFFITIGIAIAFYWLYLRGRVRKIFHLFYLKLSRPGIIPALMFLPFLINLIMLFTLILPRYYY